MKFTLQIPNHTHASYPPSPTTTAPQIKEIKKKNRRRIATAAINTTTEALPQHNNTTNSARRERAWYRDFWKKGVADCRPDSVSASRQDELIPEENDLEMFHPLFLFYYHYYSFFKMYFLFLFLLHFSVSVSVFFRFGEYRLFLNFH